MYLNEEEEILPYLRESYGLSEDFDTYEKIEAYCNGKDLNCAYDAIKVRDQRIGTAAMEGIFKSITSDTATSND